MKQILLSVATIALLLFAANTFAQQRVKGSKKYITKEVKVSNFNAISIQGSADVIFTQSSRETSLTIYGSDNIVDLFDINVQSGTLVVKFKKNVSIQDPGRLEVRISNPYLNKIGIQGSGDIKLANGIKDGQDFDVSIQGSGGIKGSGIACEKLSVSIQGSGDIDLGKISSTSAKVTISGSGDVKLNGNTTTASYSIAGSGDIEASELKANDVSASISGSGDIKCQANQSLKAHVSGSGSIGYKGTPKETDFSKKGVYKL